MPTRPCITHADIAHRLDDTDDRLDRGEKRFDGMDKKIDEILKALKVLPEMQQDIAATKNDVAQTKDIVEAWSAVKTMGKFLKWAAGIIAACSAIIIAAKVGAAHLLR